MGTPVANHVTTVVGATSVRSWYTERRPDATAGHLVHRIWHGDAGWRRRMRLLPDGCVDISWDGSVVTVTPATAEAITVRLDGRGLTTGARLLPHTAVAVLGRPVPELEGPVPLDQVWPADVVERLSDELRSSPAAAAGVLVAAIADRARTVDDRADPLVAAFVEGVRRAGVTVDGVGRSIGVSGRELRRRVRNDTGLTPKQLQEVLRFRRALDAMSTLGLARAAAVAGYCDQAHLTRQARKLAGTTPSRLVRGRSATG